MRPSRTPLHALAWWRSTLALLALVSGTYCTSSNRPATEPASKEQAPTKNLIDVNSADLAELMSLPGISESDARAIIENIRDYGPYFDLDELAEDPGPLSKDQVEAIRGKAVANIPE